MRKCISIKLFNLVILSFISQLHPQVIEKNGIFFRSHDLNPDTVQIIRDHQVGMQKSFSPNETNYDTLSLPYINQDFIVNSFDGEYGANQRSVCAAMDGNGNYAFTWLDFRDGLRNIYAQFFDSADVRISSNIKVNESDLEGNNSPFISANKNGDFVIVWLRDFSVVMAQLFSKDGNKVGVNFQVNTIYGSNTMEPSVAINDDGSFLVMWASEAGDWNYRTFAKLFDKFGNSVASEIFVNDNGPSSIGQGKHVASDSQGNYCLTFSAQPGNSSKIFIQLIDRLGQKLGANILVSSSSDSSNNYFPEISSTPDGHFLIAWENDSGVGARILYSDGNFVTDDFVVYSDQSSWHPCKVASDQDSTFLLFWLGNGYQYLQKINTSGDFIGDQVEVEFNSMLANNSYRGGLTDIFNGNFFIAPEVYERSDENIYLQKYDINLEPIGPFAKLHDDIGSTWQRKSLVRFNNKGEFIILWEDGRNGRTDLYAQVYDKDFNPVGENIQVNETEFEYWTLYTKQVESLSDGTFVILFDGYGINVDDSKVALQLINTLGEKTGHNEIVKSGDSYYYNYDLALNVNSRDDILVCWYSRYGAYLKKYNKSLNSLSGESNFIKSTNGHYYYPFAISIDSKFNILTTWKDSDLDGYPYNYQLLGKFFDENGDRTSDVFIIDSTGTRVYFLTCKNEDKDLVTLYKDNSAFHLKRIYNKEGNNYSFNNKINRSGYFPAQINIVNWQNQKILITYNTPSEVIGYYVNDNKRVSQYFYLHHYDYIEDYSDEFNGSNSADIFGDKLVFTYESNLHPGTGYDIWAYVRNTNDIDFNRETFYAPTNKDMLYANYPNPFNPKTKIAYEILAYHKVNLTVYDILGRVVKVLVDENQEKGLYEIEFDASGLSSGVYFYRLEAFNTYVKKMILLR